MRVLIYEPDHAGHHFAYVGLMLEALNGLGHGVIPILGTTAAAITSDQHRAFVTPAAQRLEIDTQVSRPTQGDMKGTIDLADQFIACVQRTRPDHIFAPYADGLSQALVLRSWMGRRAMPRGVESEALFFRGGFAYPAASAKQRLFRELSWRIARRSPYTRMHHLDPIVYDWVRARAPYEAARWRLMPDPVNTPATMTKAESRRTLGLNEGGRLVGCVGMIDDRKGADLLCRAFARAKLATDDRLLLVGGHNPVVRGILSGECAELVRTGRIVSIDRFVSQAEMDAAVMAMDLVCTPYPEHIGSASIVIRAAAAARPVLGSDFGWVERTVRQFKLGWTCKVRDLDAFARALEHAMEQAAAWTMGDAAKRYVEFQSPANFQRCWTALLRERLGLPAEPMLRTWEWVMEKVNASPASES